MRQPQEAVRLSQIARQIDALEPARRAARAATLADLARYGVLLIAYLVALAVAVIGTIRLTGAYVSQAPVVFGTAALIAAVLVTAVAIDTAKRLARKTGRATEAYESAHVETLILPLVRDVLPGCTVSAGASIDAQAFDASELFARHREAVDGRCGVEGRTGDVTWRASALRVRRWARNHNGDRSFVAAFTGTYLHVTHRVDLPQPVRLVTEDIGSGEGRFGLIGGAVLRRTETGDDAFDSQFHVLTTSGAETPALPPRLREACLEVRRHLGRPFFLAFNTSGSYVAIPVEAYQLAPFEPGGITAPDAQRILDDVELVGRLPGVVAALARA